MGVPPLYQPVSLPLLLQPFAEVASVGKCVGLGGADCGGHQMDSAVVILVSCSEGASPVSRMALAQSSL